MDQRVRPARGQTPGRLIFAAHRYRNVTFLIYAAAALAEIGGCYAVWGWMRLGWTAWWLLPGLASLATFAGLLTLVDSAAAGRAYAAYGGVYICASLLWQWLVEGQRPDWRDGLGGAICLAGAALILLGRPR